MSKIPEPSNPLPEHEPTFVRGPYADELSLGQRFEAPAVTLDAGLQSVHRSIVGGRLRLSHDHDLSVAVTGSPGVVSPAVVWDVAIGQSTAATQHVRANLFYRGLAFRRFPHLDDTLRTVTEVVGMRKTSHKPGRAPAGLVALHIVTTDQEDRPVLDFWRCALIPLSSEAATIDRADDLDQVGRAATRAELAEPVGTWSLGAYRAQVPSPRNEDLAIGNSWQMQGSDLVSCAPELARLTGNLASVHHDAEAAGGRRLVYGGHTIGLALHQVTRALPWLVTVVGWTGCDHLGPVHEGDALRSKITLVGLSPLPDGGTLLDLRSQVVVRASKEYNDRDAAAEDRDVLDWTLTAVCA